MRPYKKKSNLYHCKARRDIQEEGPPSNNSEESWFEQQKRFRKEEQEQREREDNLRHVGIRALKMISDELNGIHSTGILGKLYQQTGIHLYLDAKTNTIQSEVRNLAKYLDFYERHERLLQHNVLDINFEGLQNSDELELNNSEALDFVFTKLLLEDWSEGIHTEYTPFEGEEITNFRLIENDTDDEDKVSPNVEPKEINKSSSNNFVESDEVNEDLNPGSAP
ncbi:MAG: hypothetical protein WA948_12210 [Pontixanthobacter sp.]